MELEASCALEGCRLPELTLRATGYALMRQGRTFYHSAPVGASLENPKTWLLCLGENTGNSYWLISTCELVSVCKHPMARYHGFIDSVFCHLHQFFVDLIWLSW
jgi:hypothetical protein